MVKDSATSYCPACGCKGYTRKTKTPEWRCRDSDCGYEWEAALWKEAQEAAKEEADEHNRQYVLEMEKYYRRNENHLSVTLLKRAQIIGQR